MRRIRTAETADDGPLRTASSVNYSSSAAPGSVAPDPVGPNIRGVALMLQQIQWSTRIFG
jgi:hypothetical protein